MLTQNSSEVIEICFQVACFYHRIANLLPYPDSPQGANGGRDVDAEGGDGQVEEDEAEGEDGLEAVPGTWNKISGDNPK